jgi:2-alkenal reductase
VALTAALAPGLILGAVGTVGFGPLTEVAAQSVADGAACSAFGAPAPAASDLSVADVAEQVGPAVITVVNLQPLGEVSLRGFDIEDFPGMPEIPNVGELPGSDDIEGIEGLPGVDEVPDSDGVEGANQVDGSGDEDTLVPVGSGSGFIVDETGHAVTNAHVVSGTEDVMAVLADGTEIPAKVVGSDEMLDVAVIELELPAGQTVPGIASFGDSSAVRPGDEVVAIGTALGEYRNSVSEGTVNGVDRSFPSDGWLTTWIQHDAEIWHGNSGGPLLNLRGEVIGINTAGIGSGMMGASSGSADMAFAIEGNTVCSAAADLIQHGKIVWPYLGIEGRATADGQEIIEIVPDGPSAAAGLETGDIITAFDGQEITPQSSLIDQLFGRDPGEVVTLTVDRDGAFESFQVTLGERPEPAQ